MHYHLPSLIQSLSFPSQQQQTHRRVNSNPLPVIAAYDTGRFQLLSAKNNSKTHINDHHPVGNGIVIYTLQTSWASLVFILNSSKKLLQ